MHSPTLQAASTDVVLKQGQSFVFSPFNWVVIGLYLGGILLMGLFFSFQRKRANLETSSQEYFKASGSVPGWAMGLSVFATSLSAITFISVPEVTFGQDWTAVIGAMVIPLSAPFIIRYVIPFYRQMQSSTAYGYLNKRFNHASRMIVSAFYLFYHTIRIGVVTYLPTIVIWCVLPEANPYLIAFVIALIAALTAFWGGTRGVIWADVVQAIFLTAGILILCIWGMSEIGNVAGAEATYTNAAGVKTSLTSGETTFAASSDFAYNAGKYISANRWFLTFEAYGIPTILMSNLVAVLYSLVCGHDIVQRYQSSKRLSETKKGIYLMASLYILTFFMFYGFGTILYQLWTSPFAFDGTNVAGGLNTVAYFGKEDAITATMDQTTFNNLIGSSAWGKGTEALTTAASATTPQDPTTGGVMNMTDGGYSSATGLISSWSNFGAAGTGNAFVKPFTVTGTNGGGNQQYAYIGTTAIVPYFIMTSMPIGISGVIIASVMAAAQGTNAAGMTSGGEVLVRDMILPHHPELSEKAQIFWGKMCSVLMAVVGYAVTAGLIASNLKQVWLFFNAFQGAFGAPVFAAFMLGMFGAYVKKNAMTFGLYSGHAVAIVLFFLGDANIAQIAGWHGGKSYFNNQWNGVLVFAYVIVSTLIWQFWENIFVHRHPFFVDAEYLKAIENYTWANISKEHLIIAEVEWAVAEDEKAYAKYVRAHYADKRNSKDPLELEKRLVSFKEFIETTSYERYVANRRRLNAYRPPLFKKPILNYQEFRFYRDKYLQRELERGNINQAYVSAFGRYVR